MFRLFTGSYSSNSRNVCCFLRTATLMATIYGVPTLCHYPVIQMRSWGSEKLGNLPKVTQPGFKSRAAPCQPVLSITIVLHKVSPYSGMFRRGWWKPLHTVPSLHPGNLLLDPAPPPIYCVTLAISLLGQVSSSAKYSKWTRWLLEFLVALTFHISVTGYSFLTFGGTWMKLHISLMTRLI